MNFQEYTNLIVAIVLKATKIGGVARCYFDQNFIECLLRHLAPGHIDEFAKIYGEKVGVDYSDFVSICNKPHDNRKKEHRELPELWEVVRALCFVCEPMITRKG